MNLCGYVKKKMKNKADNKNNQSDNVLSGEIVVLRDERGRFKRGTKPTDGFDTHPENRNKGGAWDFMASPRKKMELMFTLTEVELNQLFASYHLPLFDRKLAVALITGDWKTLKEMIDEVYGQPKAKIEYEEKTDDSKEILNMLRQMAEEK